MEKLLGAKPIRGLCPCRTFLRHCYKSSQLRSQLPSSRPSFRPRISLEFQRRLADCTSTTVATRVAETMEFQRAHQTHAERGARGFGQCRIIELRRPRSSAGDDGTLRPAACEQRAPLSLPLARGNYLDMHRRISSLGLSSSLRAAGAGAWAGRAGRGRNAR
jgi:hypothetical protein